MRKLQGTIYVIAAATFFGFMPIWVKLAYVTGLQAFDFIFLRSLIAAVMLGIFIFYRKISFHVKRKQIGPMLLSGFLFTATILTLYLSYKEISAGMATSLHYLFPVLVMLLTYFIYKETMQLYKWVALFISLTGIYLIVNPGGSHFSFKGISLAILSAVFFAGYVVTLNHPQVKKMNSLVLAFYFCLIAAVISIALLVFQGNWPIVVTWKGMYYAALVGFFCTALGLIFFIKGAQTIGSTNASILSTLEPVVSLIAGVIILHEPLFWNTLWGCIMIIAAVILVGYEGMKKESRTLKNMMQKNRI